MQLLVDFFRPFVNNNRNPGNMFLSANLFAILLYLVCIGKATATSSVSNTESVLESSSVVRGSESSNVDGSVTQTTLSPTNLLTSSKVENMTPTMNSNVNSDSPTVSAIQSSSADGSSSVTTSQVNSDSPTVSDIQSSSADGSSSVTTSQVNSDSPTVSDIQSSSADGSSSVTTSQVNAESTSVSDSNPDGSMTPSMSSSARIVTSSEVATTTHPLTTAASSTTPPLMTAEPSMTSEPIIGSTPSLSVSKTASGTAASQNSDSVPTSLSLAEGTSRATVLDLSSSIVDTASSTSMEVVTASVTTPADVRSTAATSSTRPVDRPEKLKSLGISWTIVAGSVILIILIMAALHFCLNNRRLKTDKSSKPKGKTQDQEQTSSKTAIIEIKDNEHTDNDKHKSERKMAYTNFKYNDHSSPKSMSYDAPFRH